MPGPMRQNHLICSPKPIIAEQSPNGGTACGCQQFVNHALQSASATATRERLL
jgi:hypothetical protein